MSDLPALLIDGGPYAVDPDAVAAADVDERVGGDPDAPLVVVGDAEDSLGIDGFDDAPGVEVAAA